MTTQCSTGGGDRVLRLPAAHALVVEEEEILIRREIRRAKTRIFCRSNFSEWDLRLWKRRLYDGSFGTDSLLGQVGHGEGHKKGQVDVEGLAE